MENDEVRWNGYVEKDSMLVHQMTKFFSIRNCEGSNAEFGFI